MGINLKKGQGINLSKSQYDLSSVTVGLGWDVAVQSSGFLGSFFGNKQEDYDLDAIAFLCGTDGKVKNVGDDRLIGGDVIFYNNLRHPSGQIWLTGDNRTGDGDGDDEQIIAKLNTMPPHVDKIVFVVAIYQGVQKGQHFGNVKNAFIRAVDARGTEMARVDLSASPETQSMHSLVFAELQRRENGWDFKALVEPHPTDAFFLLLRERYA